MATRSRRVEASSDCKDSELLHNSLQEHTDSENELKAFCKNNGNLAASHDEEELEYERDSSKWPIKAVELMVYHRLRLDEAFNSPKYAKNKLWDGISEYLKESNFVFEGKECHLKFRNMLATYKKNVTRVSNYGEECLKWKWFNTFHDVLQYKTVVDQERSSRAAKDRPTREVKSTVPISPVIEIQESAEPPDCRKWNRSSIKMLLDLRLQTIDFFNDKVKYWHNIAGMLSEKGFNVSGRDCIIKWYNLLNTYRSNLRKSQTDYVRWEWFEIMNKIHKNPLTPTKPNRRSAKNLNEIKPDQDVIMMSDDSLRDDDSLHSPDDDRESLDDHHWKDDLTLKNHPSRKEKRHQKAYWREKLKLQKSAERRRRREWTEKKQLEIQKLNLKKQKLKLYHRLTKTLEKITSSSRFRELSSTT